MLKVDQNMKKKQITKQYIESYFVNKYMYIQEENVYRGKNIQRNILRVICEWWNCDFFFLFLSTQ